MRPKSKSKSKLIRNVRRYFASDNGKKAVVVSIQGGALAVLNSLFALLVVVATTSGPWSWILAVPLLIFLVALEYFVVAVLMSRLM